MAKSVFSATNTVNVDIPKLNKWKKKLGWSNKTIATKSKISERTVERIYSKGTTSSHTHSQIVYAIKMEVVERDQALGCKLEDIDYPDTFEIADLPLRDRTEPTDGFENTVGISVGIDVREDELELKIDGDTSSITSEDIEKIMTEIQRFLEDDNPPTVSKYRRGSVKVTIKLSVEKAERLKWAVKAGQFESIGLLDAERPTDGFEESPNVENLSEVIEHNIFVLTNSNDPGHRIEALDFVSNQLTETVEHVREIAAKVLSRVQTLPSDLFPIFLDAFGQETSRNVRVVLLSLLVESGPEFEVEKVVIDTIANDASPDVRAAAIKTDFFSNSRKFAESLIAALKDDSNPKVRSCAAIRLGRHFNFRQENVEIALIDALKNDVDIGVRGDVATALSYHGSNSSINALIDAASNDVALVRCEALASLAKRPNDFEIASVLANAVVNDEDVNVRRCAISGLSYSAFLSQGSVAKNAVIHALTKDNDASVRAEAAVILATSQHGSDVGVLTEVMANDESAWVRLSAMISLRKRRNVSMSAVLKALTSDRDATVRAEAAEFLGTAEQNRSLSDVLIDALKNDQAAKVRQVVVTVLSRFASDETCSALIDTVFNDGEPCVRLRAVESLPKMLGRSRTIEVLDCVLKSDDDSRVRMSAVAKLSCYDDSNAIDSILDAIMNADSRRIVVEGLKLSSAHPSRFVKNLKSRLSEEPLAMVSLKITSFLEEIGLGPTEN